MASNGKTSVDFYLDTACPWSWRTSVWMREVAQVRPVDVHWKFLSLEEINKPLDTVREGHIASRRTFRTMVLARRRHGDEAVNRLYVAFGNAKHERQEDLGDEAVVRSCIEEAGFSPSLLDEALADPTTEEEYVAEHRAIVERGGFGVASLVIDGSEPVFGPVIIPVPEGEEAGQLWDHVQAMSTKGYFFELKRTRT
jgi:2-hydroxychromene-2-carboxylate isomerase